VLLLPAHSWLLLMRSHSDQIGGAIRNAQGSLNLIWYERPLPLCLMAQGPSSHCLLHQPDLQRQQADALRRLHLPRPRRHRREGHGLPVSPGLRLQKELSNSFNQGPSPTISCSAALSSFAWSSLASGSRFLSSSSASRSARATNAWRRRGTGRLPPAVMERERITLGAASSGGAAVSAS